MRFFDIPKSKETTIFQIFKPTFQDYGHHHHHQVADALRHVASMTARLKAVLSCAWRPAPVIVVFSLSVMS